MSLLATTPSLDHSTELRFLLIEDSTSDCELVQALLEDEFTQGEIESAASLEQALLMLADREYDLVLADLTLPDADGGTVVRAVREASPRTALMVLTGRTDGTLALWALAEGAQDYLVKGEHDGPRLAAALLRGLQRSRTEQLAHQVLVTALHQESESAERLREVNRAKSEFVATVSHELRTPLSSISGYAELLQAEETLAPHQVGFVDAILRNANRLSALTDDLLLLSGFSAKGVEAEHVELDLRDIVAQVREVLHDLGVRRHLTISFDLPEHPAPVLGNGAHLERVVLNLVGNAIKFSEDNGTVVCRLTVSGSDVRLAVTDTGVGIPEDEREELFARFFRGATARKRAIQGTGLGLHIVAAIVGNHRGEIAVESVPGRGTTFVVRLPRLDRGTESPVPVSA